MVPEGNKKVTEFDLIASHLSGQNLIEASAGTGKTYTISRIFLRLIVEREFDIATILVVTFTEAATRELRERIFSLLNEALTLCIAKNYEDPFFATLFTRVDPDRARSLLERALRTFDTAAIHTIHGFCQRVLAEYAFESNVGFHATIAADESLLQREIAADFWRQHFYEGSPPFVAYALESGLSVDTLYNLSFFSPLQPEMTTIIPALTPVDVAPMETAFATQVATVRTLWEQDTAAITNAFNNSVLKANIYGQRVPKILSELSHFLAAPLPSPLLFERFSKCTSSGITAATKKGCEPPQHLFFDACEALTPLALTVVEHYEMQLIMLEQQYLGYYHTELQQRKAAENHLSFNDLLTHVSYALSAPTTAPSLRGALQRRFKAACIDEFQDTDALQYSIFSQIFPSPQPLFLIGDPKQSVYRFRGADIFTYLTAAEQAEQRFTLQYNYRSAPKVLCGVNALFTIHPAPFIYRKISYTPVKYNDTTNEKDFIVAGENRTGCTLWFFDEEQFAQTASHPEDHVTTVTAQEITRLCSLGVKNQSFIGTTPLLPSSIAVLVRTNREAIRMQESLAEYGVPAVIESGCSVFDSIEATDLWRVMLAILHPEHENLLRAALTTSLFGFNAQKINQTITDNVALNNVLTLFATCHTLWHDRGFYFMYNTLITKENMTLTLMQKPRGERSLTNCNHLAELLHQQEVNSGNTMTQLFAWFSAKVSGRSAHVPDEEMTRIESDRNAVIITTIHKSKGLEYPVVFLPFCWNSSPRKPAQHMPLSFHDPANNFAPVLAFGKQLIDQHLPQAFEEELSEELRLLYVAITRAKSACYLAWGAFSSAKPSALAYLLTPNCAESVTAEGLTKTLKSFSKNELREYCEVLAHHGNWSITTAPELSLSQKYTQQSGQKPIAFTPFPGPIPESWRITSFTGLTRSSSVRDHHDHDDSAALTKSSAYTIPQFIDYQSIMGFPRGAQAGSCLHAVLEQFDLFGPIEQGAEVLINKCLTEYGFDNRWSPAVASLLTTVQNLPLDSTTLTLKLGQLPAAAVCKELSFHLPLTRCTPELLTKTLQHAGSLQTDLFALSYQAEGLDFSPVNGYLKGFIDCVFTWNNRYFIIDWKSNFLGDDPDAYKEAHLAAVMRQEHYTLQYYLYTVALTAYLKLRHPGFSYNRHFGGVYYLFLRGLQPGSRSGIFFDRPAPAAIDGLCRAFFLL